VRHRLTEFGNHLVRFTGNYKVSFRLNSALEVLHELANEMNKVKREIFHEGVIADGNH